MQKAAAGRRRMDAGANLSKARVEMKAASQGIRFDARKASLHVRAHDAVRKLRLKLNAPSVVTDPKRLNLRTPVIREQDRTSRKQRDRVAVDSVKNQTVLS